MDIRNVMLEEFREELPATRKALQRIPEDKLGWKPHAKSMTLGELAMHIAMIPGNMARITRDETFDVMKGNFRIPMPQNRQEVLDALEKSVPEVEETFRETSAEGAEATWTLVRGEQVITRRPRYKAWRMILLGHWYHHRAQLGVYLRLLDVPVPPTYGPSADENPFG
jgi:uncharacterized damage-inducible protein DinB